MIAALATLALLSSPLWSFPIVCIIDDIRDDVRVKRAARAAFADSLEMGADW